MSKILKNINVNQLTKGTIFRVLTNNELKDNLLIATNNVGAVYYTNLDTSSLHFEHENELQNIDVQIIRDGLSEVLFFKNEYTYTIKVQILDNIKLQAVKDIKWITKLGLKESKDLMDNNSEKGYVILENIEKEHFDRLQGNKEISSLCTILK